MSKTLKKEISSMLLSNRFNLSQTRDNHDFSALDNDEEIREITLQLVMIRKAYDHVLSQNYHKRDQIELMKKQIQKLDSTTETCTEDQTSISSRIKQLSKDLSNYKSKLEKESQDSKSLEHVYTRTKNDLIGLEVKSSSLHGSLTSLKTHLHEYESKSRKNKEQNVQSHRLLRNLNDNLKTEQKNKDDLIKRLEKAANSKKQASERRQKRIIKQAEIAELAADQNRNAEEIALKEQIMFYKLYWSLLNYKQEKAFRDSEDAEEAFKRIRVATGLSNIKKVVDGYLKRDEFGDELQKSINEQDKQLSILKKRCEKVRNELSSILLISKESSRPYFIQLQDISKQIEQERKLYEKSLSEFSLFDKINSDLEDIFKKIKLNLNLGPCSNNSEVLGKLVGICEEVSASEEMNLMEMEKAESTHINSLLKSIYPGKDFKSKKEVSILEEKNLSLQDNN